MPSAGDLVRASDVQQLTAYKTATESVTSSTTLQDDDTLTVSVAANTVYRVELVLFYDAATAGDLKVGWGYPSGATGTFIAMGLSPTAAASSDDVTASADIATAFNFGGVGTGTTVGGYVRGLLTVSSTAGTFKVQWAQVSSTGTATRVFANSYLFLRKIA